MRLSKEQAIILTGYTGIMCLDDYAEFHKAVEAKAGRPVYTHEIPNLAKDLYSHDFMRLVHLGSSSYLKEANDKFTNSITELSESLKKSQ